MRKAGAAPAAESPAELSSGQLARAAGASKDILRFYERRGLLAKPRRSSNGYRRYPASALARVRLIRVAIAIGFSVDELSSILRVRDAGGAPCRVVRRLAGEKLETLGERIREMAMLRRDLERVISEWDRMLDAAGPGKRAGLLEALVALRGGAAGSGGARSGGWGGEYILRRPG